jgi:hypothetical protein
LREAEESSTEGVVDALAGMLAEYFDRELEAHLEPMRRLGTNRLGLINYEFLARRLLADPNIPLPVRLEVSRQLDFERKYGFEMSMFLKWYLNNVRVYFAEVE